jgi:hypothetical protein
MRDCSGKNEICALLGLYAAQIVSSLQTFPFLRGQAVQELFLYRFTSADGAERFFSRNVGDELRCVRSQKSADLLFKYLVEKLKFHSSAG